jgi:hypothetical protein
MNEFSSERSSQVPFNTKRFNLFKNLNKKEIEIEDLYVEAINQNKRDSFNLAKALDQIVVLPRTVNLNLV